MTTQQLDAQVAERVMGWKEWTPPPMGLKWRQRHGPIWETGNGKSPTMSYWQPTQNPAQAAEVLKRISPGREITFNQNPKGRWFVTATDLATGQDWNAEGDTWEMVVCLVALEVCK